MPTTNTISRCVDCGDPVNDEHNTACYRCREFRDRVKKILMTSPSAFYKIIHQELEPFQMVCVSKTILPRG